MLHASVTHFAAFLGLDLEAAMNAGPCTTRFKDGKCAESWLILHLIAIPLTLAQGRRMEVFKNHGNSVHTEKIGVGLSFSLGNPDPQKARLGMGQCSNTGHS